MIHSRRTRPAFTLKELLVVIAIIVILSSMSAWGVFAMVSTQQRSTENSLRVIDKLLHDRWNQVIADAKKETPSPQVMVLAGGDPARAKVIWIKVRLCEAFPVNYNEVLQPFPVPSGSPATIVNAYIPPDKRKPHFAKYQTTLAGKTGGGAGESSACLLMALKTLSSDGVSVEDQLKTFVKDVDQDGVPELVDAFNSGQPLLFLRFPVGSGVQAANPGATTGGRSAKFADPVDPDGTLMHPSWYLTSPPPNTPNPLRLQFEGMNPAFAGFHPIGPAGTGVPAAAFYTIPVVVSAGKDGKMDLAPDGSPTGPGAADNLFNYALRGN